MDNEYQSSDQTAFAHAGTSSLARSPAVVAPAEKMTTTLLPADPNELVRPISAYGLFFRDTMTVIKQQNPNCSFPELTRIVALMWEALDQSTKIRYQNKHKTAWKEYEKEVRLQKQLAQQSKPVAFNISPCCSTSDNGEPHANSNEHQHLHSLPEVVVYERAAPSPEQQVEEPPAVGPPEPEEDSQESLDQFQQAYQLQQVLEGPPPPLAQSPITLSGAQASIVPSAPPAVTVVTQNKCTRASCHKLAIRSTEWEDEYCSNECVIMHCRDVFAQWVQENSGGTQS